jgi:hypothetical protein
MLNISSTQEKKLSLLGDGFFSRTELCTKSNIPVRESGRMTVAQQFTAGITSDDIVVRGADD